jgi:hypothetical protein
MAPAQGAPLAVGVEPGRVACAAGSVLGLRVQLSAPAVVRARLLNRNGRLVKRWLQGPLQAGMNDVRVKLPRGLQRGAYRLMLDATGSGGVAHTSVRVQLGSKTCGA